MPQFIALFREPDGRTQPHSPEELQSHRLKWQTWMENASTAGRISGGHPLTITGKMIRPVASPQAFDTPMQQFSGPAHSYSENQPPTPPAPNDGEPLGHIDHTNAHGVQLRICDGPYRTSAPPGLEFVGGYLLIEASNLEEATSFLLDCPIFEFGAFAEIREYRSPAPSPVTSLAEKNKQIVRRFNFSYIQDRDTSSADEILDHEVINRTAPAGFPADAKGMREVIEKFRQALPDLKVEIIRQIAEDDLVVTHKRFHATFTNELMGIPPTGRKITIPIIDIVRLRNGRYIEHWGIRDLSALTPKP